MSASGLIAEDAAFAFCAADGEATSYSRAQLVRRARQLAGDLSALLRDESCALVIDSPNSPAVVEAVLACAFAGRPAVMLNHRLTGAEKRLRLEQLAGALEARVALDELPGCEGPVARDGMAQSAPSAPSAETPPLAACGEPALPASDEACPSALPGGAALCSEKLSEDPAAILSGANPHAVAVVMFTSGTTGTPKAAALTWGQLLSSARAANLSLSCGTCSLWQAALPLYHVGGLQVVVRSLVAGRPFLLYERFDAKRMLRDRDRYGATHASVVDKMLQDLVAEDARAGEGALARYSCLLLGGAAPNAATLRAAQGAGARVFASYGMTETASNIANAPVDGSFDGGLRLMDHVSARIVEPDGCGWGMLAVKGPSVVTGYLNAPALLTGDGFFVTGDVAALRDGKLYMRERAGDMFVSGGENVYPAEIERCLNQVEGVTACHVFGVPDDTWGRRPAAIVESAGDPVEVATRVRAHAGRNLAGFARPVEVAVVREIPRTGIGKVDREAARALVQ